MKRISVSVIRRQGKPNYYLRWKDPLTGRRKEKASDVPVGNDTKRDRAAAARAAGELEKELNDGSYREPSKVTWGELRERFLEEHCGGLKETTGPRYAAAFNVFERTAGINGETKLVEITAERISRFIAEKRKEGRPEATLSGYVRHLKKPLNWAVEVGLLRERPKMPKIKRDAAKQKVMKGRPITTEEFERLLAAAPSVVGDKAAASWDFYLRGLWWSGLRRTESLELNWDGDEGLVLILAGRQSLLRIPGDNEKGAKNRLMPVAPEFVTFLEAAPERHRRGKVFRPLRPTGYPASVNKASRIGTEIGEAAGVVTNVDPKTGEKSFAALHDLRRAFGERWARRVMPADLQVLMRHESIDTTMKYYVGQNAQATSKTLWRAFDAATQPTPREEPADVPDTPDWP